MTAEPSKVLNCCVVGIRRPNAGGRERGNASRTPGNAVEFPMLQFSRGGNNTDKFDTDKVGEYAKVQGGGFGKPNPA